MAHWLFDGSEPSSRFCSTSTTSGWSRYWAIWIAVRPFLGDTHKVDWISGTSSLVDHKGTVGYRLYDFSHLFILIDTVIQPYRSMKECHIYSYMKMPIHLHLEPGFRGRTAGNELTIQGACWVVHDLPQLSTTVSPSRGSHDLRLSKEQICPSRSLCPRVSSQESSKRTHQTLRAASCACTYLCTFCMHNFRILCNCMYK